MADEKPKPPVVLTIDDIISVMRGEMMPDEIFGKPYHMTVTMGEKYHREVSRDPRSEVQDLRRDNDGLRRQLHENLNQLRQMKDAIESVQQNAPTMKAVVIKIRKTGQRRVVAAIMGSTQVFQTTPEVLAQLKPGMSIAVVNGFVTEALADVESAGQIGSVVEISKDGSDLFEVSIDGMGSTMLNRGPIEKLEVGDRVIIDGQVAVQNLGKQKKRHSLETLAPVEWSDIGGLEDAKAALRDAIETPFLHQDLFKAYNRRPAKGVLLYGPPGCGKTLLAKAAATALTKVHGARHASAYIYVKGPELLSKWVGDTEQQIRELFTRARAHKQEHGYPAILFIDEADSILGARGRQHDSGGALTSTVVPQFLAEMDGFDDSSCIVLLGTNRSDALDPAVVRDGRIDRRVFVGRPTVDTAESIFNIHLSKLFLKDAQADLAQAGALALFDQDKALYTVGRKSGKPREKFCLFNIVNGAMIENICLSAAAEAMGRDIKKKTKKPSGITAADLQASIAQVFKEQRDIDHSEPLSQFCESFRSDVAKIQRVEV